MFGIGKLTDAVIQLTKVLNGHLTEVRNEQEKQNRILWDLSKRVKRIDDFNRLVYQADSGHMAPDPDDDTAIKEFELNRQKEHEALEELYAADISLTPMEVE